MRRVRGVAANARRGEAWLALVQLPLFDRWLGLLDEGYLLAPAEEINRGKVPYRDFYVDNPLPAAFYVVAAWFRLVGPSVHSARLLAVGLFTAFTVLLFRAARVLVPRSFALGLAVLMCCYRV